MTPSQIAAKQADKRTPIEQAMWNIDIQIATLKEVEDIAEHAPAVLRIIKPIREMLDKLLPAEREAIERAYNEGQSDPEIRNGRIEKFCDSSFYFTQTYGK